MVGCKVDESLKRVEVGGFAFPLGVYPVEEMSPRPGYTLHFEPADGDDDGEDWEEWPDRYVFDIVISAARVESLCRLLFAMLPGRVYPILDILGHDAHREVDPYIAYELVSLDNFLDGVRRFREFFYEDGLCGFGAMAEEPFLYVFVDEHKIVTVRAEPALKERIEKLLKAFDLEQIDEPAGADAASHEHRSVLSLPEDNPDMLGPEEIIERLRDDWQLLLNIDPDRNVDDEGTDLGPTPWRCIVRASFEKKPPRYAEVLLIADCLRAAEDASLNAVENLVGKKAAEALDDLVVVATDRTTPEQFETLLGGKKRLAKPPVKSPGKSSQPQAKPGGPSRPASPRADLPGDGDPGATDPHDDTVEHAEPQVRSCRWLV